MRHRFAITCVGIAITVGLTSCAEESSTGGSGASGNPRSSSYATPATGEHNGREMTRLEDSSGQETSRLFLEQMVMHHRGAIAMAEQELDAGVDPDAQELAREIIETQRFEITAMSELLAGL